MKLSEYVQQLAEKGLSESEALTKAKAVVKKRAKSGWTASMQKIFNTVWTSTKVPSSKLHERMQGGTAEQRLKFFKSILKPCAFDASSWSRYGLHAVAEGTSKQPKNFAMAIKLLVQHGFMKSHSSPMSEDYADRNSKRAIAWYADKYGNGVNSVMQVSDNGKSDFFILNVTIKLTREDRVKLSDVEAKIDAKYKQAIERANKSKPKKKA